MTKDCNETVLMSQPVSAHPLRCLAIRSPDIAADRRRGINEQIFGQPGGSSLLGGRYNILVIRLVCYFAEKIILPGYMKKPITWQETFVVKC